VRIPRLTDRNLAAVLSEIEVSDDFQRRASEFGISLERATRRRRIFFAYLLGFMIGDAAKRRATPGSEMFIELVLSKAHRENLHLGEFVGLCANACGIRFALIHDRVVNARLPHGRYHWKSQHSALVSWMFGTGLGLRDGQLTTYDPVSIEWACHMSRSFRISFLQGLADSDGYIHLQDQEVHLIVSPNLDSIRRILDSLGVAYKVGISKGMDLLKLRSEIVANLPIFSPIGKSYRYSFLLKLDAARRLRPGPWPKWLGLRVDELIRQGLSTGEILRKIITEEGIVIGATNVRAHMSRISRESIKRSRRAEFAGP
jgi:hypothetical protein